MFAVIESIISKVGIESLLILILSVIGFVLSVFIIKYNKESSMKAGNSNTISRADIQESRFQECSGITKEVDDADCISIKASLKKDYDMPLHVNVYVYDKHMKLLESSDKWCVVRDPEFKQLHENNVEEKALRDELSRLKKQSIESIATLKQVHKGL